MTSTKQLIKAAADNYVVRLTEATRIHDPFDDLANTPTLAAEEIARALEQLKQKARTIPASEPNKEAIYPTIRDDGQILYCTVSAMTPADVEAAQVALATELTWLYQHSQRIFAEFAAFNRLAARVQATGGANVHQL